jgi:hypothetical protein
MTTTGHTLIQLSICAVGVVAYCIIPDNVLSPLLLVVSGMPLGFMVGAWVR